MVSRRVFCVVSSLNEGYTEAPDEYSCVFKDEIWTVKMTNHTRKLSVSWFMVFTIRMEMRSSIWTHTLLACWMHKDPHVACLLDAQGSPPRVYTILLLDSWLFKVHFICVSPVKDQQLLFADSVVLVGYRSKLENDNAFEPVRLSPLALLFFQLCTYIS